MKKLNYLLLLIFASCGTVNDVSTSSTKTIAVDSLKIESQEADSATIIMTESELKYNWMTVATRAVQPEDVGINSVSIYPSDIKHLFIIMSHENADYSTVVAQATYMNQLASQGTLYTNFFSLGHPSQPNYIGNFAGISITTNNDDMGFKSRNELNIFTQMKSVGKTFGVYAEGLPSVGYSGFQSGTYYAKHDAARNFSNVDQTCRKPINQLPSNLDLCPTVTYVIPDINNSGHDTNVPYTDNYMRTNARIQAIINFCKVPENKSQFWITYDEGSATNQIFVSVLGYKVKKNNKVSVRLEQYDMVNMICDMYGANRINAALNRPSNIIMNQWVEDIAPPIDTVNDTSSTGKCYKRTDRDTVIYIPTTQTIKDSVEIPCNPTAQLRRGTYVTNTHIKIVDPAKVDVLINYCKQLKINWLSLYDSYRIWGNANLENKLSDFINRCHANGIYVEPVIANVTDIMNARKYHLSHTGKYDGMKNEFEVYNQPNVPAALVTDSVTEATKSNVCKELGIKNYDKYVGWWDSWGASVRARQPKILNQYSTDYAVHYYRTWIDTTYGKYRPTDLNAVTTGIKPFLPIISFEPAFLQAYARSHPNVLNEIDIAFTKFCKQFPHLVYGGAQYFTDDFLMLCIPYVPPASSVAARMMPVNYSGVEFKNVTDPKHLKLSTEN